jgi:hypothetical protein
MDYRGQATHSNPADVYRFSDTHPIPTSSAIFACHSFGPDS